MTEAGKPLDAQWLEQIRENNRQGYKPGNCDVDALLNEIDRLRAAHAESAPAKETGNVESSSSPADLRSSVVRGSGSVIFVDAENGTNAEIAASGHGEPAPGLREALEQIKSHALAWSTNGLYSEKAIGPNIRWILETCRAALTASKGEKK